MTDDQQQPKPCSQESRRLASEAVIHAMPDDGTLCAECRIEAIVIALGALIEVHTMPAARIATVHAVAASLISRVATSEMHRATAVARAEAQRDQIMAGGRKLNG